MVNYAEDTLKFKYNCGKLALIFNYKIMIIHFKLEIGIIGIENYNKQRYKTRSDPTANDKCDFSYTVTDNEPFNC